MARETKQAKLDPDAHQRLAGLRKDLGSQRLPRDVNAIDILSALVLYTPPPQVAGMLTEYWRYTEEREEAKASGKSPPSQPVVWG